MKGLSYLHSKNIVHRQIKARNIVLNEKGQCKLGDDASIEAMMIACDQLHAQSIFQYDSPYWKPPEMFQSINIPWHAKADIWSLGITAIEMACGRQPHSDKPPLEVWFLIPKAPAPTLPERKNDIENDWSD